MPASIRIIAAHVFLQTPRWRPPRGSPSRPTHFHARDPWAGAKPPPRVAQSSRESRRPYGRRRDIGLHRLFHAHKWALRLTKKGCRFRIDRHSLRTVPGLLRGGPLDSRESAVGTPTTATASKTTTAAAAAAAAAATTTSCRVQNCSSSTFGKGTMRQVVGSPKKTGVCHHCSPHRGRGHKQEVQTRQRRRRRRRRRRSVC